MITLKGPCTNPGCAPCGTGGDPTDVGTITCVSRQGNGELRGFSKFANFNTGDWNKRKGTHVTMAAEGLGRALGYSNAGCTIFTGAILELVQTQPLIYDAANDTVLTEFEGDCIECGSLLEQVSAPTPFSMHSNLCLASDWVTQSTGGRVLEEANDYDGLLRSTGGLGCTSSSSFEKCGHLRGTSGASGKPEISRYRLTYIDFDSVAAALARGSPTIGTACQTIPGTIGSVENPTYPLPVSITGPRAVTATAPCSGLTAATDYELTVYYDRHDSGTDAYIDTISDVIEFTAAGTTEDIEIEVPIVDGIKYTIQTGSATLDAA